jgi:tetratricopeptide (TPR) repeat protein
MTRRQLLIAIGLAGIAVLGAWAYRAYRMSEERALRAEMARAESEFHRGLYATARRRLRAMEARWPGNSEVEFRLGVCEQATGHRDEAIAAWRRVPAGSPFAATAAVRRGTALMNSGHYTEAETELEAVLGAKSEAGFEAHQALSHLYSREGREADARQILEAAWDLAPDRAELLKSVWKLETMVPPYDQFRGVLERAEQGDDRVWLGLGNLEAHVGRFREARQWLERCIRRRPEDYAVWRGMLELAQKTEDVSTFREALRHLPAQRFTRREILSLRVWLAGKCGSAGVERKALAELLSYEPRDAWALERMAELALDAGRPEEAAELRRRKAKIDLSKEPFRWLYVGGGDFRRHAAELARLGESLGRTFQSRGWAILTLELDPSHAVEARAILARLKRSEAPPRPDRARLAELLADVGVEATPARVGTSRVTRPQFTDDAGAVGLRFTYDNGASPYHELPETMAGGVALLDYDGDGWLDVYVVQGGPFNADISLERPSDRLFQNRGDGTFEDVTALAGFAAIPHGYSLGVTVGDFDEDGDPDLFVTRLQSYVLLRNRGDGTFEDVTEFAGLAGPRDNPTSAAFADLDDDGDLDLYVCHYMVWDPKDPRLCRKDDGEYYYCDPSQVRAARDHVFRNDGGRFIDVTNETGFTDPDGRGLGVVAAHLDEDDKIDLFVANDGTANYFFRNAGGFRFEDSALVSGVAGNAEGGFQAGMGIACGDLDGDGLPDLAVTNFYGQSTTLYHNLGGGMFADWTAPSGLGVATRYLLGFGITFLDYDRDGRLDVLSANGNVNDGRPYYPYAMPAQLLAGVEGGRLHDVSKDAGPPWNILRVGRALADGDLDNDGKVDALIVALNEPLAYFHNRTEGGHWLVVRLTGSRGNRDAVGARLAIQAGGRRQVAERQGGGSYQSARDGRLHFGLGPANRIESLEVRWPSGHVDVISELPADAAYDLREGEKAPRRLLGYSR